MNISIEKKRNDYPNVIPNKGWSSRDDLMRKASAQLVTGKQLDYYYSNTGSGVMDLTKMESQIQNPSSQLYIHQQNSPQNALKKFASSSTSAMSSPIHNLNANISLTASNSNVVLSPKQHQFDNFRSIRSDASLVPPIRQTASIFKQPVTVVKTQESKVKSDLKHGTQEKPKQLFWEKRLENFTACDSDGTEFAAIQLPKQLRAVGPEVKEQTLFQSVSTALHASTHPITGQTTSKSVLANNPGVFIDPEQPLMYQVLISEEDIKKQQDRVELARKRLQEALKA